MRLDDSVRIVAYPEHYGSGTVNGTTIQKRLDDWSCDGVVLVGLAAKEGVDDSAAVLAVGPERGCPVWSIDAQLAHRSEPRTLGQVLFEIGETISLGSAIGTKHYPAETVIVLHFSTSVLKKNLSQNGSPVKLLPRDKRGCYSNLTHWTLPD